MAQLTSYSTESHSINRSLFFNGEDYSYGRIGWVYSLNVYLIPLDTFVIWKEKSKSKLNIILQHQSTLNGPSRLKIINWKKTATLNWSFSLHCLRPGNKMHVGVHNFIFFLCLGVIIYLQKLGKDEEG